MEYKIEIPEKSDGLPQDEEFIYIENSDGRKKIRCHDYHELYAVPGLYEKLFYEKLKCCSPHKVCSLLESQIESSPDEVSGLVVLDLGAGNGMVGQELSGLGVESVVGVDIIEEAQEAVERDRPGIYDDYLVTDFTRLDRETRDTLEKKGFNCMTSVAALGFGDIPPLAFAEGFNLIENNGWVAFNIKEEFITRSDSSPFSKLIDGMIESDVLKLQAQEVYRHRLALDGTPLYYVAMVGVKQEDIPLTELALR